MYVCISLIFFISGLQLAPAKLKENLTNWRLHIIVQGISFLVTPAIVLGESILTDANCGLRADRAKTAVIHIALAAGCLSSGTPSLPIIVGLLATACLPTTIASNVVMTRNAGGDDAAAVISVVIGNITGTFLSPVLIYGFMPTGVTFEPWRPAGPSTFGKMYAHVAKQLGLTVLVPLAIGQAVRWWKEKQVVKVLNKLRVGKFSTVCLILVVW